MATRTKPLMMSAAALASAAAVAVASPALAPSIAPSTTTLSKAAYELTTFADVLSIPAGEWTNVLFSTDPWGGAVGPDNPLPIEPYASYCDYGCTVGGISGVAYLALDALINGTGSGWTPTGTDADGNPTGGYTDWNIGVVNYLFEPSAEVPLGNGTVFGIQVVNAGWSAAAQYVLQATLGTAFPALQQPIEDLFYGPINLTRIYRQALLISAQLEYELVPLVGTFLSNSTLSYLGYFQAPGNPTPDTYYVEGLSGVLQYWGNLLNGSVDPSYSPFAPVPNTAAAKPAAARHAAVTAAASTASAAVTKTVESAAAAVPGIATPATPATPAAPETASAVADTTPAAVKTTRQRPVRDAVTGAAKAIGSAVSGAAKAATGGAAAASKRAAANGS